MTKKFKCIASFLLAATLLSVSSCKENTVSETSETSASVSEVTRAEASVSETGNRASMVDGEPYITHEDYPKKLFTERFIVDSLKGEANRINEVRRDFTNSNKFYDFTLTYDVPSSDIPADVRKKAEEFVKTTELYAGSINDIELIAADDNTSMYVSDGVIEPKFHSGYEYDFDGDGTAERFLVVTLPEKLDRYFPVYMLLFEDSSGRIAVVDRADYDDGAGLIDYGDFKQLIFGSEGFFGYRSHHNVYGVVNGEAKALVEQRAGYEKKGCFLYYYGWMGSSALMIFDTNTHEYRTIHGYPADTKKLKELDKENVLELSEPENEDFTMCLIYGERYVISPCDQKCYRYENGKFTDAGDAIMLYYPFSYSASSEREDGYWFDVDIDYALSASGTTLE